MPLVENNQFSDPYISGQYGISGLNTNDLAHEETAFLADLHANLCISCTQGNRLGVRKAPKAQ